VHSADFVSPPPVVELSWESAGSDSDDAAAQAPPDISALLDAGLLEDDDTDAVAKIDSDPSPAFHAGAAHPASQSRLAMSQDHAPIADPDKTPSATTIGSLRPTNSFIVHSKKHSMIQFAPVEVAPETRSQPAVLEPPLPIADVQSAPSASGPKQNSKMKRGSVFTVAATQLMQQNLDKFKLPETVTEEEKPPAIDTRGVGSITRQPESKDHRLQKKSSVLMRTSSMRMPASEDRHSEETVMETELDWSPGSEFVKFASITTLPSLKIIHPPAITDEYMATLAQYKSEFISCVFNASSNRNRSSRMKIFTGRQFVEFCLSDMCKSELRLTERGSAIGIGKLMCLYDFIHEVEDEHDFADSDDLK
jgi:hypothetical protein